MAILLTLCGSIASMVPGPNANGATPTVDARPPASSTIAHSSPATEYAGDSTPDAFVPLDTTDPPRRGGPVPDPSTVLLVLAGVGVIVSGRRYGQRSVTR